MVQSVKTSLKSEVSYEFRKNVAIELLILVYVEHLHPAQPFRRRRWIRLTWLRPFTPFAVADLQSVWSVPRIVEDDFSRRHLFKPKEPIIVRDGNIKLPTLGAYDAQHFRRVTPHADGT